MKNAIFLILACVFACSAGAQSKTTPAEKYQQAMSVLAISSASQADRDQAFDQLQSAAEQNYMPAQTALGTFYARPGVVQRNVPKAMEWFSKAAEHGDWIAQLALGRIYFLGDGVAQDTSLARQWLSRAADSGDGVSAYYLGLLYDGRLGAATDKREAARWFRQSAETGNPYAQERLANQLYKGLGVGQDQREAYEWYLVAVEFGNSAAAQHLNSMEIDLGQNVTKSVREEAVDLRREILAKKSKDPCNGWPGQYDLRPTAPPLAYVIVCEKS